MIVYFLPFNPQLKVNYYFILALYKIAKYNPKTRLNNLVQYQSMGELAEQLKQIGFVKSKDTISAYLKGKKYKLYQEFFTHNKEDKTIILNNDFRQKKKVKFIVLTAKETDKLLTIHDTENDTMMIKTYIYLKFFCGLSNIVDDTQEQILDYIGYSSKSGKNCQILSSCVNRLRSMGFINVVSRKDNQGHNRNFYSIGTIG